MSHYTENKRTNSRNGIDHQPIEPAQSTLDTIAKIRADNEAIRKEEKRIGRKMSIEEQKSFLLERDDIAAALDEAKAEMVNSRMERLEDSHFSISWFLFSNNLVDLALAQSHRLAAGVFAGQIVAHL